MHYVDILVAKSVQSVPVTCVSTRVEFSLLLLFYVRLVKFVVVVVVEAAPILYYNNSQDNSSVAQAVDVKIAIKMFTHTGGCGCEGKNWGRITCSVHTE